MASLTILAAPGAGARGLNMCRYRFLRLRRKTKESEVEISMAGWAFQMIQPPDPGFFESKQITCRMYSVFQAIDQTGGLPELRVQRAQVLIEHVPLSLQVYAFLRSRYRGGLHIQINRFSRKRFTQLLYSLVNILLTHGNVN